MFPLRGIDSATLATLMSSASTPARCLGVPPASSTTGAADERYHARRWRNLSSPRHENIEVTEAMVCDHFAEIVACIDDPDRRLLHHPPWVS